MKVIGITGGVGAGKTTVIDIIADKCKCRVIIADVLAKDIQKPGNECYDSIVALLGDDILENGKGSLINNKKMADKIFAEKELLKSVNEIIHPAVKKYILDTIAYEKESNSIDYLFIEAALLIEDGYNEICDELWYIYADEDIRIKRLMENRGYSEEKSKSIINKQLSDEVFRKYCTRVIDNSGDMDKTVNDIDLALRGSISD